MTPALCILAAGRGSRLGPLTEELNKGLLPLDHKAAISHIIEKVPVETPIVVAVGFDKEKLTQYCRAAHPDRDFTFVDVEPLEGPGSGPGTSLLCCKPYLQRPFWLCNVDTIVEEEFPRLDFSWIGVQEADCHQNYATADGELNGQVKKFQDKSEDGSLPWCYIGLAGIRNYDVFWRELENRAQAGERQYVPAFFNPGLYPGGLRMYAFHWQDTGTPENYEAARKVIERRPPLALPKAIDEVTYHVGNRVIKLTCDTIKNMARVRRGQRLPQTPNIVAATPHLMAYDWIPGAPLADERWDQRIYLRFLDWCQQELWSWRKAGVIGEEFRRNCHSFYKLKTMRRFRQYQQQHEVPAHLTINGIDCASFDALSYGLDWDGLADGIPARYHGDLQLDNVILDDQGQFRLLDWRESFGTSEAVGDVYYDLAKLYALVDLPYHSLRLGQFTYRESEQSGIHYSYQIPGHFHMFLPLYRSWMRAHGYDVRKVQTLAGLIYLNMAPLHPGPAGQLLFAHGTFILNIGEKSS